MFGNRCLSGKSIPIAEYSFFATQPPVRARPLRPSVSESRIKRIRGLRGLPPTALPQAPSPSKRREVRGEICPPPYRHSPIPPAPVIRFAHCRLRLCLRGKGERMAFLKGCIPGCFDGFARMDNAMNPKKTARHSPRKTAHSSPFLAGPIPPAPVIRFAHCRLRLCLRGKGERMAFLKVCIPSCFDGFARMDNAMNPKKPIAIPLAKPLTVPPSS